MTHGMTRMAAVFVVASALAGGAQAQTSQLHLGPRISYHFDAEDFGIGAQFSAPIADYLEFYPSFDYFFVDPGSFWTLNADLKYRIAAASVQWLYLGAGLQIARRAVSEGSDTNAGANLIVGAESLAGRVHPFGEFRVTVGDGSSAQIAAGLNFTLRRR